jgi:hypothetical protein
MTVVVENEIRVPGLCGRQWLNRATYGSDLAYERRSDKTAFGVGFLSGLQHCPAGLQSFEDKRSCPDFRTGPLMNFTPDDYQEAMLAGALCADESTLIGQEDIEVGLEIVRRRRTSCIVLAGTDDIAKQWVQAFDTRLQLEPGRITVDECSPSHVTVATVEAVCSRLGDDDQGSQPWEDLGCDPGLVIVDGCDLVPVVEKLRKAVRAFRPRYRCGFVHKHMARTAELMLLCHELGPVVYSAAWGRPLHDHPSRFEWRLKS